MNPNAGLLVKRRTIERRAAQGFNRRAIARELGLPLEAVHLALARTAKARERWTWHAATRFRSAVASIPWWHERLSNFTILREDTFAVVERIEDSPRVVVYVDPPYVKKGAKYLHDFVPDDHARLATTLRRFKRTRVVVSYYDHPLIRELYDGWTCRRLKATKALVNQGMRDAGGAVEAPEVLLINGPSFVEAPAGELF